MQDGGDWEDVAPGGSPPAAAAAPAPATGGDWEDVPQWGGYAPVIAKSAARGVITPVGTAIAGLPELPQSAKSYNQKTLSVFDRIDRGERVPMTEDPVGYQDMDPETRKAARAQVEGLAARPERPIQENPLYKAGTAIEHWAKEKFPLTPEEEQSITSRATSTVAGMVPIVATAPFLGPGGAMALGATQMGLSGAHEHGEAARAKGATPEEAREAALAGGLLDTAAGLLPMHMVMRPVERMAPGLADWALARLKHAAQTGVVFAGLGEAQEWLGREIAKAYYDPEAGYAPDIKRVLGSLLGGAFLGGLTPTPYRGARPAEAAAPAAEAQPGAPAQPAGDVLRGILGDDIAPAPAAPAAAAPAVAARDNRSILEDEPQAAERPDAEEYVSQAMRNLAATSRTANGVLDTSSTPGKSDDMTGVSATHAATLAKENYEGVVRGLYDNLEQLPTDGPGIASLIDTTAEAVNDGIVKPGQIMRTRDTKIPGQTAADDLPAAHEQFSQELAERLADPNADPVETAAWIEWRSNIIDHFWTDGVGKTSKALAAIPLMRAGLPLPRYPSSREFYSYSPKERVPLSKTEVVVNGEKTVDRGIDGQAYLGPAWDRFNEFYHTLVGKPEPEQRAELKQMLADNAPLADINKHPLVQRTVEDNRRAVQTGSHADFANPEWWQNRVYDFGGESVRGGDAAVEKLTDQAKAFSTAAPVENGHHAVIVLGPPAAGKSTVSEPLARSLRAALVDPDEAKKVIPEYRNGMGSSAVHEESSKLAKRVITNIVRDGTNLILPKVGDTYESIKGLVDALKKAGYTVDIAHVAATPELSHRRNINRFLETGRVVDPEYITNVGDKPRDVAYMLKGDANDFVDASTSQGFEIVEGSGPLADALRARRNIGWRPDGGDTGRPQGSPGQGQQANLIGEPIIGMPPHRVTDASGRTVEVAPIVVEADSLRTSRDYGYDPELQPRDRDRAASEAQVRKITNELDPERLGYSSEADRGAPIIGADGMVESGNGRVLALRRVYDQDGKQAQAYRDWLARQGVNVDAFRNPVIVRQRLTALTPKERQDFTRASNQSATLAMSAPERAVADAKLLDARTISLIKNPEDLGSAANRPFFRRFVAMLPQVEQGGMADAHGALSAEGITRVRNALLAKAYGDSAILTRIAESTNDEVRSISSALTAAAPEWARMRAAVDAGHVRPDVDVTRDLVEAVSRTAEIRSRGEKLDDFLRQQDAFDRLPAEVEGFMRMFYNPKNGKAAPAKRITDALRFYAQQADKVSAEKGLGLDLVPVEARDILRHAVDREWEDVGANVQEPRGGAGDGAGSPAVGREVRGSRPGEGGEGAAPGSDIFDKFEEAVRAQQPTLEELRAKTEPVELAGKRRGEQFVIPGGERISSAELARRRAAEPMKPKKVQQALDFGLFGEPARQLEMPDHAGNLAALDRAAQQEGLNLGEQTPITGAEAANGTAGSGPAGQGVRGGAQEVPGRTQARRLAKTPAQRPGQLSLFGGGAGERPVHDADDAVRKQPGSAEATAPGTSTSVTKPPARSSGSRAARPDTPAARGRVEAQQKIAERSRSNYRITPEDQIGAGNARQKIRGNIEAIRLLKTIQDENRMATPAEKAVLVKYVGWGAFAQDVFATHKPEWKSERDQLRALISDEEYNAAKASTLNAHFTSPDVIRGMWDALVHMGYSGGQAIEPAAGVGHFIGMIPDKMAPKTAWTAVELDTLTGGIAKALYGGTDVNVHGFETLKRPSNYYDLAISNVPFGDYHLNEKPYGSFPIHDFFFVKSLDKVRPGGVVAFITSRYTMDRMDPATRRLLGKTADMVGAIRLPGGRKGAFAGNAGTEVTTDIIFLRRKVAGENFPGAKWDELKTVETPEGPVQINEYFADRPDMMLGEMRLVGSMYRDKEPVLLGDADGIQERIAAAAERNFPKGTFLERGTPTPPPISGDEIGAGIKDGSFFLKDGKLYQRREGQGHEHPLSAEDNDRVTRLIGMRDLYNDLLQTQLGGGENAAAQGEHLREKLRSSYDAFVKKHGPINKEDRTVTNRLDKEGEPVVVVRYPNLAKFRGDPDVWKVASLESYDSESGKAKRADVQTKDVIAAPKERQINGPSDALSASLNDRGIVDLDHIAQSLNVDNHDDVVRLLGDMIYQNPDGRQWETADAYLSGNVVKKLDDARAMAEQDPSYLRNVAALEKAQPAPLVSSDIVAQFGAPWVPAEVYQDFLGEIGIRNPKLRQVPVTGEWAFQYGDATRDAQAKYGTDRVEVGKIVGAALNNKQVTVYDHVGDKAEVNEKATTEARVKTELLKEAFTGDQEHGIDGWVFQEPARSDRLAAIYNRTYNNLANRKFDGTHLTLPGLNPDFSTRQHRKDAVWRIIQNGNTLLAHVVGSGKTVTMIAAGMEEKRLGLVNKPAYVIPNHMLEQFSREFIQAYPNAKILVAEKDEMTRERRKEFLAKVASNDWDGVIITHDAFGRINTSQEFRRQFIQDQLDELERVMVAEAQTGDKKSPTIKNLEKAKKKLQGRLENLMNEDRKDAGTSFEESGIDRLYVDEAHKFKNLQFITRLQRVKGLAQGNSQRAEDLFLKIRYLEQKRPGRSAVFATGTPVSNTMAELWTMQRYLQLDKLRERGLDTFDSWASTFGRVVNNMVLSADGRTFKEESSFSKFVNVPELVSLYSEIADTKTADMLNLPRPEVKTRSGAPGIEIVEAMPSSQEEAHIDSLVKLAESLKGKRPEKGQPNMLSVVTAGRKVATDGRLISGDFDFNPQGKLAKAVDNISRIYQEGNKDPEAPNKVQMVFLDMGVPQTRSARKAKPAEASDEIAVGADPAAEQARIDLYADLKQRLVDKGIPAKEIGAIHDANDDTKKAKLFDKVRKGEVRVILGSSEKMGVGTNVQDRLIAMHHIDAPWKPADVEQRDGRIVRQGNKNKEVQIYRYVTKKSFDAFMWQKLDTKAKFIGQVLSGAKGSRHAEDIDNPLPEAAEMKAAASGDPRIMEHAELDRQVRALSAQRRSFDATRSRANQEVGSGKARIEQYEKALPTAKEDADRVTDISGDKFVAELGGAAVTNRAEAGKAILERIAKMDPRQLYSPKVVNIGRLSGFDMNMEMRGIWNGSGAELRATPSLRGKSGYGATNDSVINEHTDPAGLIRRFENILAGIKQKPEQLQRELARERESVASLQKTLGQTWPREADYRKALGKLDDLSKAMKAPTSPDVAEAKADHPFSKEEVRAQVRDLPHKNDVVGMDLFGPRHAPLEKRAIFGLPLNPLKALDQLKGESFCVSFGTRQKLGRQLDDAIRLVGDDGMLLVDNGAFTLHKQGKSTMDPGYIDEYERWAQSILDRSPRAVAVIPDVIGGTEKQNAQLVMEWQLDPWRSMAIWHMHESLDHLKWLIGASPNHVGIGSSGEFWQTGTPKWHRRIHEAMDTIAELEKTTGDPRPRVHMMRAQSQAHLYGFDSSDSTNLAVNHGRTRDTGEGHVRRLADRIKSKIEATSGPEAPHQIARPIEATPHGDADLYALAQWFNDNYDIVRGQTAPTPKEFLTVKGKPTWAMVMDPIDNAVLGTVSYKKAADNDFHHSFYLPDHLVERVDKGEGILVWADQQGVHAMEPLKPGMRAAAMEYLNRDVRARTGWESVEGDDIGPRLGERVVRIAGNVTAHVSPIFIGKERELADAVQKIGERLAPQANVKSVSALRRPGNPIWGAFVNTEAFPHLVAVALEGGNPQRIAGTMRHEVIHHLRSAGLIRPDEWQALEDRALKDNWLSKYNIPERYSRETPEIQLEEAIAEHFKGWRAERSIEKPGLIRDAFQRMDLMLRQVAAAARRFLGKNATADDVFTRIETGEVGRRVSDQIEAQKRYFAERDHGRIAAQAAKIGYSPAVKIGDHIFTGSHHGDALDRAASVLKESTDDLSNKAVDGFIDHDGEFVERLEAYRRIESAENEDVRAQTKTPQFKRWFGDSKVVDEDGEPKAVYHGTDAGEFSTFDRSEDIGFHFGTKSQANERSDIRNGEDGSVMPVYLRIKKPLRLPDMGDWSPNEVLSALVDAKVLSRARADDASRRDAIIDREFVARALRSKGYDGIVYLNMGEGKIPTEERGGFTRDESQESLRKRFPEAEDSYIVFDPAQIKSATGNRGTFDPDNADIRAQTPGGEARERRQLAAITPATLRQRLTASTDAMRASVAAYSKQIGLDQVIRDIQMRVAPMAVRDATVESRAVSKEYMNARRQSRQNWNAADKFLMDNFPPERRKAMWEAADEQSVAEQQKLPTAGIGLDRLSPAERSVVETLQGVGRRLFDEARSLKMVQSEGLPSYAPRFVVRMVNGKYERGAGEGVEVVRDIRTLALANSRLEDAVAARRLINDIRDIGKATGTPTVNDGGTPTRRIGAQGLAVHALDQMGRDFSTTTPNLRHRKYLTTAETEAAAARVPVRDEDAPSWFTLNHPSFQTLQPRLEVNPESGKVQPVRTENGDIVFDRKPIYIRSDFEGPLRSVLSKDTDRLYRGLMRLKGMAMSVIMMSPLIHNQVEWGRALPAAPGKVLTFQTYLEGNKIANDPAQMRQAISGGVVPIGGHGFMQDIVSMAEAPTLRPGRSLTAKGLGYGAAALGHLTRLYDPRAGADEVRSAVDWFGNFWHNTLLWDRIRDLQMGLWSHINEALVSKGYDPYAANVAAAHFANRYAGALPIEAMSGIARGIANVMLFSRSFTLGNLGAFKDAMLGLPRDAQALIQKNVSHAELQKIQKYVKNKSRAMLALDAGLYYATLSVMQSAFNTAGVIPTVSTLGGMIAGGALGGKGGQYGRIAASVGGGAAAFALANVLGASPGTKKLEDELTGYWDRFSEMLKRTMEHPFEVVGNPVKTIESLSATADNEPTLRGRLMVGYDKEGTAIYARLPAGKVTEELIGYLSEPNEMIHRKLSTIARPLDQIYHNDVGFGRKVYDPKADTPADVAKNIYKIAALIVKSQLPTDTIKGAADWLGGGAGAEIGGLKAAAPFLGFSVRKGYPGGPELGVLADASDRQKYRVSEALSGIRDQIRNGDVSGAVEKMNELHIPVGLQSYYIRTTQNPKSRLSKRQLHDFMQYATPEQQQEFTKAQGHAAGGRVLARANGGRVDASNINHAPTEAQKSAGNYAKDHVNIFGLDLTIENAKGSVRRGVGPDGKPWACVLPANYGYIKRTHGQDDDHVDAYLGPHIKSPHVFLIDQHDLRTGKMDEHKVMLGFGSQKQALGCYERAFSDGKGLARIGGVTTMTIPQFKEWLAAESEKRTHSSVNYTERSTGNDHCAICKHFVAGNPPACTGVKSPISAAGWCQRFKLA